MDMFNNSNQRSFYFLPCTATSFEQSKERVHPTMQKGIDDFVDAFASTPHKVIGVVAVPGFDYRCVLAKLLLLDYWNAIKKYAPFIKDIKIHGNAHLKSACVCGGGGGMSQYYPPNGRRQTSYRAICLQRRHVLLACTSMPRKLRNNAQSTG